MRIIIQRVLRSAVRVEGAVVGQIDRGLNVLVGFTDGDNEELVKKYAEKLLNLRVWEELPEPKGKAPEDEMSGSGW